METVCSAISCSFVLDRELAWLRMPKACSAVILWRSMRMPLASRPAIALQKKPAILREVRTLKGVTCAGSLEAASLPRYELASGSRVTS